MTQEVRRDVDILNNPKMEVNEDGRVQPGLLTHLLLFFICGRTIIIIIFFSINGSKADPKRLRVHCKYCVTVFHLKWCCCFWLLIKCDIL